MTGLSDLNQKYNPTPGDSPGAFLTKPLKTVTLANPKNTGKDLQILSGQVQKKQQLQSATDANAAAEAANTAQIASDASAAEAKRQAALIPTADDAAMKANKRRIAAAQASSGGRDSTILTGQRLGD